MSAMQIEIINRNVNAVQPAVVSEKQKNIAAKVVLAMQSNNLNSSQLQMFIDNGLDVNAATTYEGDTLLHHAAYYGQHESIQLLLEAGADVAKTNISGNTALHLAAYKGRVLCVITLLNAGNQGIINCQNNDGSTALHLAVYKNHMKVVRTLLKEGAAFDIKNHWGKIPVEIAAHQRFYDIEVVLAAHKFH